MAALRLFVPLILLVLFGDLLHAAAAPDLEDRTREIATELRCVVCQNLSVADSPSDMAQQMRALVREQVQAGKTTEEIKEFFVSKYGEWVLLKPRTTGFSALLWILPYVVLVIGVIAALWFIHRWTAKKRQSKGGAAETTVANREQRESLRQEFQPPDGEDQSRRAQLMRERGRLRDELNELEFDFQSGKFSPADYAQLRQEIEAKGTGVLHQLGTLPAEPGVKPRDAQARPRKDPVAANRFKRWQLITGGVFLLLFGLALGVMLTQSLRPRQGEGDTMTGDFMTGTSPASGAVGAALAEGKQAFSRQDFPKAIEAFKKALAIDPNLPEAHAYMGFILVQAGHGDGALMAFDKALAQAPNFPMALWGKGMVLYQDKKDFAGARVLFERLMSLMPAGAERNEVAKALAEIPAAGAPAQQSAAAGRPAPSTAGQTIAGTISVDAKLKDKIDPQAALFIIARPAGGPAGPPLAVRKIDRPAFPLNYTLSQENVMMQGAPFSGKINITVRLDKDGNPTTRGAGDLSGEYKKNPAEVGAKNVDVVIDQAVK